MDDELFEATDAQEEAEVYTVFGNSLGGLLIENGYPSLNDVYEASDEELLQISGIGQSTLRSIRDHLAAHGFEGGSAESATTPAEVKPDATDAEAAEGEIAEPPSAEEAPVAAESASTASDVAPEGAAAVRSLFPSTLRVTAPSGQVYLWERSGVQVNVAAQDLEFVMGKNRNTGRACCGGSSGHRYFELA